MSASDTPELPLDPAAALQGVLDFIAAAGRWEPPTPDELAPLFTKFHIEELIGRGGMGAVYKATQSKGGEPVAIKVLPIEMAADKEFVAHFFHEALTLAKLDHPGIVAVHSFGQTDAGHLYFVMEYVDGGNLHRLVHCCGLAPRRALAIMSQVCDALECAHRITTHGDIKPGNIVVGPGDRAKLADFGLARPIRAEDSSLARTYFTLADSPYLAPERRTGDGDKRSDLFSLGVLFYEMLTGHTPARDFVPASRKVAVDPRADAIIIRAMQPDPARRYQSAGDMKRDIDRLRGSRWPPALRFALPLLVLGALAASVLFALKSQAPTVAASQRASTPPPTVVERGFTPPAATDAVAAPAVDPIVGRWRFFNKSIRTFALDGTSLDQNGQPAVWRSTNPGATSRRYEISYEDGKFTDRLTMNEDGTFLEGRGFNGIRVHAWRIVPPFPADATPESIATGAEEIARFRETLLATKWHYTDVGWPSSTVLFFDDGTFHPRWHWNYWIVGRRTIHVQFWDPIYKPETADVFTFDEDLTKFTCPKPDGSQRIEATRMELIEQ